ncbi:hypothetical protein ACQW02_19760 [Humitalea sp. 24SJ18S-53]|uniref:hypothetical protein n=1 Tax=Humitalea sp. 24SJ18S-53 TaxID=3422307 RepID=UPI003D670579
MAREPNWPILDPEPTPIRWWEVVVGGLCVAAAALAFFRYGGLAIYALLDVR